MNPGFLWAVTLVDFIKWSPLLMLFLGTIGFLISRNQCKSVKIVSATAGVLLPIIWVLSVVDFCLIMAIASESSGRNFLFTDRFDVPLHNNYQWTGWGSTDCGIIYNIIGTDGGDLSLISEDFDDVWRIQEEGDWLAGSHWNNTIDEDAIPGGWFLFNTRTHQRIAAKSKNELQVDAAQKGFQLHLQSCHDFYLSRHSHWVAVLKILLLLILPVIGLDLLRRLAIKLVAKDQTLSKSPLKQD